MEIIRITGVGSQMQGVGKLSDGRVAFVEGALPGERVSVRIKKDAGRYCEANLVEILDSSDCRAVPACVHYGMCGGCRIRHAEYDDSLALKRTRVTDAISRIAGIHDANVRETIGCTNPERTRNKAEYAIRNGRIGMFACKTNEVIKIEDCLLQSEASVRVMHHAATFIEGTGLDGWLVTRVNRSGEVMVILSAYGGAPKWLSRMMEAEGVHSVYFCALKPRPSHALDGKMTHVAGAAAITETLCGLRFEISPQTFFQVNTRQAEVLYALALDAADLNEKSAVLDAYCGCGTMTLAAARRASYACGIEIVSPAIEDARRNASVNGLSDKTEFICADASREIRRLVQKGKRFDRIILDPPRKGCDSALLDDLRALKPESIAYVSCDPSTLARDMKLLVERGFRLEQATPVDMFPWTGHVECVTLMSRK